MAAITMVSASVKALARKDLTGLMSKLIRGLGACGVAAAMSTLVLAQQSPHLQPAKGAPKAVSAVFHVDPPATVWRRTVEGQLNSLGPSDQAVTIGLVPVEATGQRDLVIEFRVPLWFGEWVSPPEFLKVSDLQVGAFPASGRRELSLSSWQRFQAHSRRHPWLYLWSLLTMAAVAGLAYKHAKREAPPDRLAISGLTIGEKIGEGAMGEVFRAALEGDGAVCAVKLLKPEWSESAELRQHFDRELSIYARLKHPGLPSLWAFGYASDGRCYLATDYLRGQTLKQRLPIEAAQREALALQVLEGVGAVLDYLHQSELVHQDVKPSNIFLTEGGEVKLLDLGVARRLEQETATAAAAGTPAYMAPEQLAGVARPASDQYGLGLVAFEILTGRRPWDSSDPRVLAHQRSTAPPPTGLGPSLDEALGRMLSPDSGQRYANCQEAFQTVKHALERT